ncbi:MAG: O-antigen ligase family protein [Bacteroidota bacterium]
MTLKEIIDKRYLTFLAASSAIFIIPIHVYYLPPFMILWGLCWVIENYSRFRLMMDTRKKYLLLFVFFISYYLWQAAGLIYSEDIKMGYLNLFGRLSLILFPLVLFYPGERIRKNTGTLLRLFASAAFIYMVYCFLRALFRSIVIDDGVWTFDPHPPEFFWLSYFYASQLTLPLHPSYISIYVLMSVMISLESWFDHSMKHSFRYVWLIIAVLLAISIFFLSSRAGIICSLIMIPLYLMIKLKNMGRWRFAWLGVTLLLISLLPLIIKNQRVASLFKKYFNENTREEQPDEPRFTVWNLALKISRQNLLLGVGIGDVRNELVKEYEKNDEQVMAEERYNVHNQFLEVLLENGLIGAILFISIFICMIYIAVIDRNILYGSFIFLIIFYSLFETILYRLAGVSFFPLFSFLLLHYKNDR